MKQSHASRLKSPKVRQHQVVLPIVNLPGLPQPAQGWINPGASQIPPAGAVLQGQPCLQTGVCAASQVAGLKY